VQRTLLVVIIAGSVAAFGSADERITPLLILSAAVGLLINPRAGFAFPMRHRRLDLSLILCVLVIAVQLVPLPPVLHDLLSPHARDITGRVALPASAGRWMALSIEPHGTREALATFATAVLMFWMARGVFASGGIRRFCRVLAVMGVVASVTAVAQRTAPTLTSELWLVNRNHFAGWLLLVIPLTTGYLMAHVRIHFGDARTFRDMAEGATRSAAAPLLLAVVLMTLVLTTTLSRSALIGLAAASAAAWLVSRQRLETMDWGSMRGGYAIAAIGLVLLLAFIDPSAVAARVATSFDQRSVDRLVIWRETLPLIRDFWATGTGAGTYGMAMIVYQRTQVFMPHLGGWAHFNQAHSHYVQVAAEGGLLLTVPVVLAVASLIAAARQALRQDRGEIFWVRAAAAASLMGMAVQSIWETSLRMPANAVLCAAIAGALVHRRHREDI
jgi:O-antigen ligase